MVYVLAFFVGCGSNLIFRIFVMFSYLHFYWYSWVSGLITDGGAEAMWGKATRLLLLPCTDGALADLRLGLLMPLVGALRHQALLPQ